MITHLSEETWVRGVAIVRVVLLINATSFGSAQNRQCNKCQLFNVDSAILTDLLKLLIFLEPLSILINRASLLDMLCSSGSCEQ